MSWRPTVVALVVAVLAAGLTPATATSPVYPDSGMGPGRTQLVSVDGHPIGGSNRADAPAVSDSGRFIAYTQTREEVPALSLATPGPALAAESPSSEVWRRDIVAGTSTRVSGIDAASAPSISGNGRLVAYGASQGDMNDVFVADLSGPGSPVRHRVTGLATDVPFQRTEHCAPAADSSEAAPEGCGPVLSGDGRSLAIPVDRSIVSPQLALDVVDDDSPYPPGYVDGIALVDFAAVPTEDPDAPRDLLLYVEVVGPRSVRFGQPVVTEGPFTTYSPGADCAGQVVEPGRACYFGVRFVPAQAACGTAYGMLRVASPTPDGQTMVPLVGERLCPTSVPAATTAGAGDCPEPEPAEPNGDQRDDPGTRDTPVFVGESEVGGTDDVLQDVALGWEDEPVDVRFSSSDCALALTPPPGAEDTPNYARTDCYDGGSLDDGKTSCVAHVRFRPQSVRASVATLQLVDPEDGTIRRTFRFIAGGRDSTVVMRRDPSGSGRFSGPGTPPARIVSVDADGEVMSGTAPTLSGDGRYLAFVSGVTDTDEPSRKAQVFVHDTDASADGTWVSGDTVNASLVEDPAQGHERYAEYAVQPSLSGDGRRLAFVDLDREYQANGEDVSWVTTRSEVQVRDLERGITRQASVSTMSDQPSLGRDGRTAAFASIIQVEEEDQTQIYVTDLPSDLGSLDEPRVDPVSLREDGTSVRSAESPAVSADGGVATFVSSDHLTDEQGECCDDERKVFARTRYPGPMVTPAALTFSPQQVGTTGLSQPVFISNDGPGPFRITTRLTEGFVVTGGCEDTLHRGESCELLVAARPQVAAAVSGELTLHLSATDWAGDVVRVALSVTGVTTQFLVKPETVTFGDQGLGTSSDPVAVSAVNVGNQPVDLSAAVVATPATASGPVDFQVTGPGGSQNGCRRVAPRAACAFQVRFRPGGLGLRAAQLVVSLTLGDVILVQLVELAGKTAAPELELSPSVAREGRVVFLTGTNFLPGGPLEFGWSGGPVVARSVVPSAAGTFTMPIVILPGRTGTQTVTLTMPGIGTIKAPELVVAPGSLQPPSFVSRN